MIIRRFQSFGHALRGLRDLVCSQANARNHLAVSVLVVLAGMISGLGAPEWCLVVLAIGQVWTAEALNSAIEHLADAVPS